MLDTPRALRDAWRQPGGKRDLICLGIWFFELIALAPCGSIKDASPMHHLAASMPRRAAAGIDPGQLRRGPAGL
jgi:hypothetical protein